MDKRTIFFVLSLSLSLLAVNMFFDRRHQEELTSWHAQEKVKKQQKISALKQEIVENSTDPQELPIVAIKNSEGSTLSGGIRIKDTVITTPWTADAPESVTISGQPFQLVFSAPEGPVIYEKSKENMLKIVDLPYFGTYDLQLVSFTQGVADAKITLGSYSDGNFTIPAVELQKLEKDVGESITPIQLPRTAVALMKTPEGYMPAAVYFSKKHTLVQLEQIDGLATEIKKPMLPELQQELKESFYILENDYQQLVFSSKGGALVEINLPYETENNKKSVVKEIEFDKEIEEEHPFNARFPLHSYYTPGESANGPFTENSKGKLGGYYPLLRRDLIQKSPKHSINVLPEYYGLNVVSQYPEVAQLNYKVTYFDTSKIVFEAVQSNRKIIKTYTFDKTKDAPYVVNLTISIEGDARGLWLTSGVPEVEWISNAAAPALKYRLTRKGKAEVNSLDLPKESITINTLNPDWVCNSNGFFGIIIDPLTEIDEGLRAQYVDGNVVPSRLVQVGEAHERFKAQSLPGYQMMLPLFSKGGTMQFRIFAGPFADKTLRAVDQIYSDTATGYNPDYIGSQSFHGWFAFISAPFAKFLFVLMKFFHQITGSWGISIILLTVALRIMLFPLNAWSTKSMLKMQQLQPEVLAIQEKHKKDPKKAQLEVTNLYMTRGVNPVSGCFPLLIQLPFLIGMFDLLKSTFELRGAPFIPGWIDNLAAPDVLFTWTTPIFFIGNQFHLLPILLGAVMFVQQRVMSNSPKDPKLMTDQQRQQKAMGSMMTVVFAVMFYHFPSGLNIYWLSSMLLGILQQWWTQKRFKSQPVVLQTAPEVKGKRGKKK
jgi:YidC/Oxa1 family membrane protein insertase